MDSLPQSQPSDDIDDNDLFGHLLTEAVPIIKAVPSEAKRLYVYDRESQLDSKPDTFTPKQYRYCFDYWHNACCLCGSDDHLQLDHWIPVISNNFPGTIVDNMLPLCRDCNIGKSNYEPKQWVIKRFGKGKLKQIEDYLKLARLCNW